jgi:hypothetical protein
MPDICCQLADKGVKCRPQTTSRMNAASLNELKRALDDAEPKELKALCLRMAKFKKENKELLSYLLFEAQDESGYVESVKHEVSTLFEEISNFNTYYLKKSLRRILKHVNKQIKYSGLPETEVALRIHFCKHIRDSDVPLTKSVVLMNMYDQQLKKIHQALEKLHEDLQYDYNDAVRELSIRR